jgi:hypothetical protein
VGPRLCGIEDVLVGKAEAQHSLLDGFLRWFREFSDRGANGTTTTLSLGDKVLLDVRLGQELATATIFACRHGAEYHSDLQRRCAGVKNSGR